MLIPKQEAQPINFKIYEEYTSGENKLEMVDGFFLPFNLYNMGLKEFISILPQKSKVELFHLLQNNLKE